MPAERVREMKHILICGERHVGKSTLIRRFSEEEGCPLYGFITRSLVSRSDGFHEIYMYPPYDDTKKIFLAECDTVRRNVCLDVFESYGIELLSGAKDDGIIIMDELGFMEENAEGFKSAVLNALDGDIPVIAAVKSTNPESVFLNAVRSHPNTDLFMIDEKNRDELYTTLKARGIR